MQNNIFVLWILIDKGTEEISNEAAHLLSRYEELQDKEDRGLISQSDLTLQKNILNDAFLKIAKISNPNVKMK